MKTKFNIAFFLLLVTALWGCTEANEQTAEIIAGKGKNVQVSFEVMVPPAGLPSSRAISNDAAIDKYVVWVFNDGAFKEAVSKGDTYTEGTETKPRISWDGTSGGQMYIILPEEYTAVTLMIVANAEVDTPAVGTSFDAAKASLGTFINNDLQYMPLYGELTTPFAVALGAKGNISLLRAMAKVEVRTEGSNFQLDEMYVYRVNRTGTIAKQGSIINNQPMDERVVGTVAGNSTGSVYIPEIAGVNGADGKGETFIVMGGTYTSKDGVSSKRYYRLDFIKRITEEGAGVRYEPLGDIERNHRYIFDIDYLTDGAGHGDLDTAVSADADNRISETEIEMIVIDDKDIMDITTDNYIYLGVTAGKITASEMGNYYTARIRVVTNNQNGWQIETLPEGVSVTLDSWRPELGGEIEKVNSTWVYLEKAQYSSKQDVSLYIYSGNIRKTIQILIP